MRLALDRHEDMQITGHRHPFLADYKVGMLVQLIDVDSQR